VKFSWKGKAPRPLKASWILPPTPGKAPVVVSWLLPLFSPPEIPPACSCVDRLDCAMVCEAPRELIWVLPPLLNICELPLRPCPCPRPWPRPVYPVFRLKTDGSWWVEVLICRSGSDFITLFSYISLPVFITFLLLNTN